MYTVLRRQRITTIANLEQYRIRISGGNILISFDGYDMPTRRDPDTTLTSGAERQNRSYSPTGVPYPLRGGEEDCSFDVPGNSFLGCSTDTIDK
jgi:hypothetical protein